MEPDITCADGVVAPLPGVTTRPRHNKCDNDTTNDCERELTDEQETLLKAVNDGFALIHRRMDELFISVEGADFYRGRSRRMSRFGSPQAAGSPKASSSFIERNTSRPSMIADGTVSTPKRSRISKARFLRDFQRNPKFERRVTRKPSIDWACKSQSVVHLSSGQLAEDMGFFVALHPDSIFKLYWDMFTILFVLFELITVPYLVAWSVQGDSLFSSFCGYASVCIWTVDIPVNFISGYYDKNAEAERRLTKASKRYLKKWFLIDFILVSVGWATISLKSKSATWASQLRQISRIFKLVLRVPSKIPRARDLYARILLRIDNKNCHSMLAIIRLVLLLVLSNHVMACLWYSVGKNPFLCGVEYGKNTCEETWLTHEHMKDRGDVYHYLSALHWCVTQMTLASMEIFPENSGERLFTIVIIFAGLLLGISVIAAMTGIITSIRVEMNTKENNMLQLQRFLAQEKVPKEVGMVVMRQVKCRLQHKPRLHTSEVAYVHLTSHALQIQLKYEIHMKRLYYHNFFGAVDNLDNRISAGLCNNLRVASMEKDDLFFEEARPGAEMYFITLGVARYIPGLEAYEFGKKDAKTRLEATTWFSEPALWLADWTHLGTCVAEAQSEVLSLGADILVEAGKKFEILQHIMDEYSTAFQEYFNQLPSISDCASTADPADVFYCLGQDCRLELATKIIENMQFKAGKAQAKKLEILRAEIEAGKCNIAIVPDYGLMRTVFLTALKVCLVEDIDRTVAPDGLNIPEEYHSKLADRNLRRRLCMVAEYDKKDQQYKTRCVLPGSKRRAQESAIAALNGLLTGSLEELARLGLQVDYQHFEDNSFSQLSPTYGLYSRYGKVCFTSTIMVDKADKLPKVPAAPPDSWTAKDASLAAAKAAAAEENSSWHNVVRNPQSSRKRQIEDWVQNAAKAEDLLKKFNHIICLEKGNRLYLWLTPAEMDILTRKEAAEVLKNWLALYKSNVDVMKLVGDAELLESNDIFEEVPLLVNRPICKFFKAET